MSSPLIVTLPLIEGETPSGFVSRLSRLYETPPRNFCTSLGLHWPSLCTGKHEELGRLAWLTDNDLNLFARWSAPDASKGLYRVGSTTATQSIFRRTLTRCCPKCVLEARNGIGEHGIFELLEWKVLSLSWCAIHQAKLISLPTVPYSHEAYDFVEQAIQNWPQITNASNCTDQHPVTDFEKYVRSRIYSGHEADWLFKLDLTNLHSACFTLGATLADADLSKTKNSGFKKRHELLNAGFMSLTSGPNGLRNALEKLHKRQMDGRQHYSSSLGPFYHWLNEHNQEISISQIVETTREHIFETYPIPSSQKVLGYEPRQEALLTIEAARRRTGFGAVFLKRLLGHIAGADEETALLRCHVTTAEISAIQTFWSRLFNLKEAASALSIRTDQIKALMRRGVLSEIHISSSLRYALKEEVINLQSRISELSERSGGRGFLPIRLFCRNRGTPLAEVVRVFLSQQSPLHFRRGRGSGISALEISSEFTVLPSATNQRNDLVLSDVAKHLKIGIGAVRLLRNEGYLKAVDKLNLDTNHKKSFITRESIQDFEAKYTTLGQLASCQGKAAIHLARELDRNGFAPLICGNRVVRVYDKQIAYSNISGSMEIN